MTVLVERREYEIDILRRAQSVAPTEPLNGVYDQPNEPLYSVSVCCVRPKESGSFRTQVRPKSFAPLIVKDGVATRMDSRPIRQNRES